jgi:hypothetical protein
LIKQYELESRKIERMMRAKKNYTEAYINAHYRLKLMKKGFIGLKYLRINRI